MNLKTYPYDTLSIGRKGGRVDMGVHNRNLTRLREITIRPSGGAGEKNGRGGPIGLGRVGIEIFMENLYLRRDKKWNEIRACML